MLQTSRSFSPPIPAGHEQLLRTQQDWPSWWVHYAIERRDYSPLQLPRSRLNGWMPANVANVLRLGEWRNEPGISGRPGCVCIFFQLHACAED